MATAVRSRVIAPTPDQFEGSELLPAPELDALLTDLTQEYPDVFAALAQ